MKKLTIILLLLISISCKTRQVTVQKTDELTNFFLKIEKDIKRSAAVITEKELVKYLTHLQKMNNGGKHYYPLERENLTKMIKSLSSYDYSECILINKHMKIVYTMYNNDIFSKSILQLENLPLQKIFTETVANNFYIEDITSFYPFYKENYMVAAINIINDNISSGILVVAINTELIKKHISPQASIMTTDGYYKIHNDPENFMKKNQDFIESSFFNKNIKNFNLKTVNGKKSYTLFNFKNLYWYIVK